MGEDDDLVSWILCSFCDQWCHGSCVNLQFDDESAKGIVKFKCPKCRNFFPDEENQDDEKNLIENNDLRQRLDKVNLLLDQEKDLVKSFRKKEREQIRKTHEEKEQLNENIKSLKAEIIKLKKEKSQITTNTKQSKAALVGQAHSMKEELKVAKQEKESAEKRAKAMKATEEKQLTTVALQVKKIATLQLEVEKKKDPEVSKERIEELKESLVKQENLYNSVLSKLSTAEKQFQGDKVKMKKAEKSYASLEAQNIELQKAIEEKEKEMAAHVEIVSKIIESEDSNDTNVNHRIEAEESRNVSEEVTTNGENMEEESQAVKPSEEANDNENVESQETDPSQVQATEKIKDLKKTIRKKDTEIQKWKSQFSALEGTLSDANLELTTLKEEVLASKAEASREKDINDSLLFRINQPNPEMQCPGNLDNLNNSQILQSSPKNDASMNNQE